MVQFHLTTSLSKNNTISLEIIVAVLNSKISNLYIENENIEMNLTGSNLLSIPFPELTTNQKECIIKCVKQIENDIDIENNMNSIDSILYEAFNLDDNNIKIIESYYSKFTSDTRNNTEEDAVDTIEVTGIVLDINLENKIIKASFVECEEEKSIEITSEIPGWLLAEDASFVCRMPEDEFYEDEIKIMDIRPLQYTYLNDEEYQNLLMNKFNDYEPKRKALKNKIIKEMA